MNERLTIQDLTDLLAAKHGMTKKDAEAFVKEFFLLIEQALEDEKAVKIKGLGTFKLIDVDSRESVNLKTGERYQIKGHTKVSFSPDANLRDTINKPFAHFETVVLNENTILEDTPIEDTEEEEAEEETSVQTTIQSSMEDSIESPVIVENVSTVEESIESSSHIEPKETITITDVEEKIEQLEGEEIPEEEVTIIQQPAASIIIEDKEEVTAEKIIEQEHMKADLQPVAPIMPTAQKETMKPVKSEQVFQPSSKKTSPVKEKSPVPYLIAVIVIVLLLCGGVILFIYYPDLFSSSSDKNVLNIPPVTTQPVQPETQLSDTIEQKDTIGEITPDVPPKVVTPTQPAVYLDSASYKITGTKTKYTIKEGETLTRVSLRFYGTKAMWPYIVKHNPKVIKNPNNVPYGTTIEIPELAKE
ncbi:MAG: HU family DNA-binding protein [Bacteroides sp.]|nr:HU family DNA-binding protein [Bacteroides sp.]